MSEKASGIGPKKLVRYCVRGHEIVTLVGEMMRNVCPYCNSPVDRTRRPIAYEELQRMKEEQAQPQPEKTAAVEGKGNKDSLSVLPGDTALQEPYNNVFGKTPQNNIFGKKPQNDIPDEMPQNDIPDEMPRIDYSGRTPQNDIFSGTAQKNMFGRPPGTGFPGQRSGNFGFHQAPADGFHSGYVRAGFGQKLHSGGLETGTPGATSTIPGPGQTNSFGQKRNVQTTSGFYLSLFGDRISIPAEGAWIGREGLGREWFDGNLMISRKHVYVRPNPQTGRLQINEDKSLNGVFVSGSDGKRERLTGVRMMEPGEVLWIYNVPLQIESSKQ